MYKIIGADEKEYGPVSAEQIKDWIRQGRLNAASKVQAEGSTDWKPIAELAEFADALPARPAQDVAPAPVGPPPVPSVEGKTSSLAIWSLVLGIVGLPLCGLGTIAGLVLGILAIVKINQSAGALKGRGLAIAGIVISSIALLVLPAAMLLPALARAKGRAQSIICMNNLKQLGLGMMMYRTDNKEQWPAANKWCDAIHSYVVSDKPFKCVASTTSERSSYAFNARLAGTPGSEVRDPARTVLVFECEGGWNVAGGPELLLKRSRHLGAVGVVFADGHSEMVRPVRVKELKWEP
jgi:prepilin-type processing-associated H-X9-DG protein